MIDFSKELNAEQFAVVENGDGPCLVLAGAGSGKTRTITYRVAYLLEKGVKAENILLVTFTNKAAGEMKERVLRLMNHDKKGGILPWSGTFHHIGYRILKVYAPLVGYQNNFSILDTDDSEALLKLCAKEAKSGESQGRFPSAGVIHSIISYSRNAETTIDDVMENRYVQWIRFTDPIKTIAAEYEKRKKEANAMDFDDLLVNFRTLLTSPTVREKFAKQFEYILVDEYQDTNKIQASIIKLLASVHSNVLVVGDDAQSIYSFRAADIQNILRFEKEYPGAKIFKLQTNYRSTEEILELANNVIANNIEQYPKRLRTITKSGLLPALYPHIDQQSEASFVARKIQELIDEGTPHNHIAVLFRAAHHSQMLEIELVRAGIEYDYRGGIRFFERAHVKDILAYLRILTNIADTAAWLRVLLHEEGIGPAAAQKVIEALRQTAGVENVAEIGNQVLGAKAREGWYNFLKVWKAIVEAPEKSPLALIEAVLASPYREYVEAEYVDSRDRLQDIKQLALFAERYDNVEEFLAETTLQEGFRNVSNAEQGAQASGDRVVLSTIHQAKGLEWTAVFILNLSAGGFPSDRALSEDKGIEEERRLFYVAITRAKKYLFLTYPMAGGAYGDFLAGPSMFINEINPALIDDHSLLSTDATVLNDPDAGIEYIPEDEPKRIKPGSFLRDIDDL